MKRKLQIVHCLTNDTTETTHIHQKKGEGEEGVGERNTWDNKYLVQILPQQVHLEKDK